MTFICQKSIFITLTLASLRHEECNSIFYHYTDHSDQSKCLTCSNAAHNIVANLATDQQLPMYRVTFNHYPNEMNISATFSQTMKSHESKSVALLTEVPAIVSEKWLVNQSTDRLRDDPTWLLKSILPLYFLQNVQSLIVLTQQDAVTVQQNKACLFL